ncbi:6-phosphogluconolactonase [Olivibacter domesticus]|nr:6-phosphogluconolactonase [Olivibacter domesticus]
MIKIFKDPEELSIAGAELFVQIANEAIKERGVFTVALTGGSSPANLYKLLAHKPYSEQINWHKVHIFWGDERWVPLSDDKSNAKMAYETLLNYVPIPKEQIYPMWTKDLQPKEFAQEYEQTLQQTLGSIPSFDLILLGMGEDGHTASLFPGTDVLQEKSKWVDAYYLDTQEMYRITLTAPVINQARNIVIMAYGTNKANALHEVLEGDQDITKYPAQLINPQNGMAFWFVDTAAASRLHHSK